MIFFILHQQWLFLKAFFKMADYDLTEIIDFILALHEAELS